MELVSVFKAEHCLIDSARFDHSSDEVLAHVAPFVAALGFVVETGKKAAHKIVVPVLYGNDGAIDKAFNADAHHLQAGLVLEVEAGRAVTNNQFLKDLFQACTMDDVRYLAIAVRNTYKKAGDFTTVVRFLDTLYASQRIRLPLSGVLIIGY